MKSEASPASPPDTFLKVSPSVMNVAAAMGLCLVGLLSGCGRQSVALQDATKAAVLVLTPLPSQRGSVHTLHVRIRGAIDGEGVFFGDLINTQQVSGRFDLRLSGDYFSTNCVIRYSPLRARSGKPLVEYEFSTL